MRKASSGTVGEDRQSSNRALLSIYLSIYIHIYIYRERERERFCIKSRYVKNITGRTIR